MPILYSPHSSRAVEACCTGFARDYRQRLRCVARSSIALAAMLLTTLLPLNSAIAVTDDEQSDNTPGSANAYHRPPNLPRTPSMFQFSNKDAAALSKAVMTQVTSPSATDDVQEDVSSVAYAQPSKPATDAAEVNDISDDLSIAPWVRTTHFNPSTGETRGQSVSNLQYDAILKDSPIDQGFGYANKSDLWERLRNGFALNGYEHTRVDQALSWYVKRPKYLDRVTERAKPFLFYILSEVEKRGMPAEIALLPIVESAFQPFAYSPGSAAGLWQFIPATGKRYGLQLSWWYDGRRDVYTSTQAALEYLSDLHEHFNGSWLLALAAYNSGQGTVDRAIRENLKQRKPTDFWSLELPDETRGYVPKLLAISTLIADPGAYNVTMNTIPNRPYFERINIGSQIDLARAADMAGMSIEQLYTLNPAFNRWATDPDGPHYLIVPLKNADRFLNNLASLRNEDRIQWQRHQIAEGETLGTIANHFQTTASLLQKINNLDGKQIRAGKSLIIPVATRSLDSYTMTADQRLKALQNRERAGKKIFRVVEKGDTLWELAQEYDVDADSLAAWNGMAPSDPLYVGKKLVIWANSDNEQLINETNTVLPVSFTAPATKATTRKISYRVREGDSLSIISEKFKVTISELREWNSLQDDKFIHPGQQLHLIVDVTRQTENI